MFRIRRIYDDAVPANRAALQEVQMILRQQFYGVPQEEIDQLPEVLRNPFKKRFRAIVYVAESQQQRVLGFALLLHEPELRFSFLDYIATAPGVKGRGVGAALYERVRDEALRMKSRGLFFECLPDEPAACRDETVRKANASRFKFYERYGATPIIGTAYETPTSPEGDTDNLPHLMFDGLDLNQPLARDFTRKVVRAVLERKYGHLCSPAYVKKVVESFRDDPIRLRPPRYTKAPIVHRTATPRLAEQIALTINDKHDIHHIRERGYVESPARIAAILSELRPTGLFDTLPVKEHPLKLITAVHGADFVQYLQTACAGAPQGKSVYPYVFPVRNATRPPKELSVRAGYWCIDTFTPIHRNAFPAAKRAVDCTLTAGAELLKGRRLAYSLVRPPGHHAERRLFGGFCYFNNAAIAAQQLCPFGRVAILDIDYHHGNGQQDIFYERSDVLTVSIHGDPDFAYPYFTGFADETGQGAGEGYNLNLPLPEVQDGEHYRKALAKALKRIDTFDPSFLIVCLGLDTATGDPTGTWSLRPKDFHANGRILGELGLPTLVVQEGGYRTRTLGVNARHFFEGLAEGAYAA